MEAYHIDDSDRECVVLNTHIVSIKKLKELSDTDIAALFRANSIEYVTGYRISPMEIDDISVDILMDYLCAPSAALALVHQYKTTKNNRYKSSNGF